MRCRSRPAQNVRRESIVERFVGRYVIGPPRFSNQAATIHIFSNGNKGPRTSSCTRGTQIILLHAGRPDGEADH